MIGIMVKRIRAALLIVCATSALASAEGQPKADQLFAEGRALLANNKPAEACEKFEAAIKLDATATGTMLNLGLCYENLKKYATSIKWFRKAQVAAAESQLHEYEQAAKDHTTTLTSLVNTLKIEVSGPADAEVRVDGSKVEATEYGRYEVDPGTHQIVGRAAGKRKVVQSVDVPERKPPAPNQPPEPNPPIEISIALTEDAVPVYVDRGAGRRKGAIILGSVGVASLAFVGIWGGIYEKGRFNDDLDAMEIEEAKASKNRVRFIGTGVFVVGVGAIATAAWLYFGAPGKEQVSDGTAFAPVIGEDELGFAVSGRF